MVISFGEDALQEALPATAKTAFAQDDDTGQQQDKGDEAESHRHGKLAKRE